MKAAYPQHFASAIAPNNVHNSDLGDFYFYDKFVLGEFKEGVNVSFKTSFNLLLTALKHLGTKPFFIISNRINSYSVQPTDYKYLNKVPNLVGIAIVTNDQAGTSSAMLEAQFFKRDFEVFNNLESAKIWGESLLDTYLVNSK